MRVVILSVVATCTLFPLIGCSNRTEVEVLQPTRVAELKPVQQNWRGILSYADCEGIKTSPFLEKDGTQMMNECYRDVRDEPSSFASYGTWARTADKSALTSGRGEKPYYRAKGEALEMLDREGNPIESQFNYTFQPVSASLSVIPISIRDMYFHMADVAIPIGCTAGKRMPVVNNTQLGRDYLVACAENGQSVLLTLEARFTLESNPDTGEKVRTLMTDKDVKFILGKACN